MPDRTCKASLHDAIPLTASSSLVQNGVATFHLSSLKYSPQFSYYSTNSLYTVFRVSLWAYLNISETNWHEALWLQLFWLIVWYYLYNDGHLLHLRPETVAVRRLMNMVSNDYDGQMIPGTNVVLELRKNPEQTSTRKLIRPENGTGSSAWQETTTGSIFCV